MSVFDKDSRRVDLLVCTPYQPVRMISAKLSGQISALQTLWPENPKKFIYNGTELLEKMTFDFYGIKSGDSIIALPQEQNTNLYYKTQWLSLTKDSEAFRENMEWMMNPKTAGEVSRLRDLHLLKMENKPKVFTRMCSMRPLNESPNTMKIRLNTQYKSNQEPSTEPLPIFWENEN
ncbi:hypothetical protein GPJ56_002055 [Histomonas meleagridis]|uniref:uncharacterized protein n=1 Tax=Histomonas meleagridis TaxID=135588 RepID=UPI00355A9205|nr:hypothetical protein GPJ56_002055 [Histomonas meleagridis]KAH0800876.1 hypothetical protein GO595_006327 [Histomonas meleagridis]